MTLEQLERYLSARLRLVRALRACGVVTLTPHDSTIPGLCHLQTMIESAAGPPAYELGSGEALVTSQCEATAALTGRCTLSKGHASWHVSADGSPFGPTGEAVAGEASEASEVCPCQCGRKVMW